MAFADPFMMVYGTHQLLNVPGWGEVGSAAAGKVDASARHRNHALPA